MMSLEFDQESIDNFNTVFNEFHKQLWVHANLLFYEMSKLLEQAEIDDDYSYIWDRFWELSGMFPYDVEWIDYDTSYEEDILQRYNALKYFIEGNEGC